MGTATFARTSPAAPHVNDRRKGGCPHLSLSQKDRLVPEQRQILLSEVARYISETCAGARVIVAIDGVDGAGKTTFAGELTPHIEKTGTRVLRASVDGFHNPRAVRYARGASNSAGFYLDSYNYPDLRKYLIVPFKDGSGTVQTARFDLTADSPLTATAKRIPSKCILLFEGIFLHRPELREAWTFSIFLDVPFAVAYARMAVRDGGSPDPSALKNRRYRDGQKLYMATCAPAQHASLVIDNADLERPRIIARPR